MPPLVIAQQFGAPAGARLRAAATAHRVVDTAQGPAGWQADVDVLLAAPTKFWRNEPPPDGWPGRTRWVQLPSTGIDGFPAWLLDAPCVTSAPGLHAPTIAEFVMAQMLAFEKRIPEARVRLPSDWRPMNLGTLRGRTLGLAGVGAIGREVARLALGFGMRVIGLRRSPAPLMDGVEIVHDPLALAAEAHHLVLCMPSTPATRHVVDARFLAACQPGLHIVNVARGDLIDQEALRHALDNGTVARASLDVTTPEPLPEGHALYGHARVHLTPHVAWNAPDSVDRLLTFFLAQLGAFATSGAPRHAIHHQTPID